MSKSKKILYAFQGTGNGHTARASEIIPILQKHFEVDVWVSGHQSDISLNQDIKHLHKGIVLFYTRKGGVSIVKTVLRNNLLKAIYSIFKAPVKDYDLVINDFEFITAYASRLKGVRCIQISHQGAFKDEFAPRPRSINYLGEFILRYYSPSKENFGLHFYPYHSTIFPPVIRNEIRNAQITDEGHYTVYLPAFHHQEVINFLSPFYKTKWHVFTKHAISESKHQNIKIFPVDNYSFVKSFTSCTGILCSAGFEAPAEAMHMGKKLAVLPIKKQYEQKCNAAALKMEGVLVFSKLDREAYQGIRKWILAVQPKPKTFPDYIEDFLLKVI